MLFPMPTNHNEISEILQELIKLKEINVSELARRVNLPQPTVQRIVSGAYKQPRSSTLQPVAEYFGVTINQLRGFEPIPFLFKSKKTIKSIPLLGSSQIREWPHGENITHYVVCDKNLGENSFAINMPDSSMEPVISKGAILLIDPTKVPQHGSFIILRLENFPEIIVRQLITDGKDKFIKPLSPDLNHLGISALTSNDIICGVVVEIRYICEEY